MTTSPISSLQDAARLVLDELAAGHEVRLEITARDAETGALLLLILAFHEAAIERRVGVHVAHITPGTIQLSLAAPA